MFPTGTKFKIRSAKEREEELEKVIKSVKKSKEEVPRLNPYSAPSPDADVINKRRPRPQNNLSFSKDPESSFGTKTSPTIQGNQDGLESPFTNVRGRTEWRPGYTSSRSKSLDWRGARQQESGQLQTVVFRDTVDIKESSKSPFSRSENKSLASTNLNKPAIPPKRLPSQVNITKKAELSVFSDRSPPDQTNSDSVRSPLSIVRGRTEWRQTSTSTRSKSVDWKGIKNEAQRQTQTVVNQDATDFNGSHSETSEKKNVPNSPVFNELIKSPNRLLLKKAELQINPEMSDGILKKLSSAESQRNNVRGRTEWRQGYNSNRSKSFDWRAARNEGNKQTQSMVVTNTIDFGENSKCSEKKEESTCLNTNELTSPRTRKPLQIYTGDPEKCDSNGIISSAVSGTSRVEMAKVSLAQASGVQIIPSKLKRKQGHDSTDEGQNNWRHSGHMSDKKEHNFSSQVCELDAKETAGGDNTDAKSVFAPDVDLLSSSDTTDSDLNLKKYTNDSLVGRSSSSISDVRSSSYTAKKGGTFPRTFSKEVGIRLNSSSDASSSSPIKEDTLSSESSWSYDRLFGKDSTFIQSRTPEYSVTQTEGSIGMGTNSQDRARNKYGAATISRTESLKSAYDLKTHDFLNSPGKKREDLSKKIEAPSLDSVRNKIHKFEALFQQSQSPSHNMYPKRTLSVVDTPKEVTGVSKSHSDRCLSLPRGNQEWGFQKDNHFHCSEGSSDVFYSPEPPQITTDKERSTVQTPMSPKNNLEFGVAHTLKVEDEILFGHQNKENIRNKVKTSMINKHMDEPDHLIQNVKSMDNNKDRHHLNGSTDISHFNPKDPLKIDLKDYSSSNNHSKPKQDKAFQATKSTTLFPNKTLSTSVKSKSAFNPFSDSSTSGDINNVCSTIANKKAAAKVSRWIMGEGDGFNTEDDDDDEGTEKGDDSDSGDSSITITSNMSHADHKSFSVSFVELCSLGGLEDPPLDGSGLKNEENWMNRKTSSISSDVSALSCVSLLGAEELDSLLEDVRGLGDDALQNYEDIQVVVLHKEVGIGLGFTVAGGVDQNKPVTVHRVLPYGLAAQEGSIHEGDHVLSINGTALHSSTHQEALHTLRKARKRSMAVVVVRRGDIAETYHSTKDGPQTACGNTATGSRVRVTLIKSSSDLGFSLKGGVGSSMGDEPLTVQRLFQGGPVGQVFPGDELLEVEGQSLRGLRRLEAWNLIKRLPSGPVEVVLQRYHQYHPH